MKSISARITTFLGVYFGLLASLWGMAEIYTYFTGDKLRVTLGSGWILVFYGAPLLPALVATFIRQPKADDLQLSREELERFTRESVDPHSWGNVQRPFDNVGLSDGELRRRIIERNRERKPSYLLRMEYERRLTQRGL
jgi:hypothetical protein